MVRGSNFITRQPRGFLALRRYLALAMALASLLPGCGLFSSDKKSSSHPSFPDIKNAGVSGAAGPSGAPFSSSAGGSAGDSGSANSGGISAVFGGAPAGGGTGGEAVSPTGGAQSSGGAGGSGGALAGSGTGGVEEPPPVSVFCGDGIRDPVLEECDDLNPAPAVDACSADCRVQSVLGVEQAGTSSDFSRKLQGGQQAISAAPDGFAVVYVQGIAQPALFLAAFDASGARLAPVEVSLGSSVTAQADPAVAALSANRYAVAWVGKPSGTGDILLRTVDVTATPILSAVTMAHAFTAGAQELPAILALGQELIVAWQDSLNLKYRRFSLDLVPLAPEQPLVATADFETSVSLAAFSGTWAAAWRVSLQTGERVRVSAGSITWETEIFPPGPVGDRPSLTQLDASHLLLVLSAGGPLLTASEIRYAILDTAAPGSVLTTAILPLTSPYADVSDLNRKRPSVAFSQGHVYVAWETESPLNSALGQEPFFQELGWSALAPGVLTPLQELPLIVNTPRTGDQVSPLLALLPRRYSPALATTWIDASGQLPNRPNSDLIVGIRPLPLVTLPITPN